MKPREVIYAPEAGDDLDWIYNVIADATNPVTANRYDRRIRAFCERLDVGSHRGALRGDIRADLRIVGFERRVTIAFAVDETRVVILRLFYGGADWEKTL